MMDEKHGGSCEVSDLVHGLDVDTHVLGGVFIRRTEGSGHGIDDDQGGLFFDPRSEPVKGQKDVVLGHVVRESDAAMGNVELVTGEVLGSGYAPCLEAAANPLLAFASHIDHGASMDLLTMPCRAGGHGSRQIHGKEGFTHARVRKQHG